MVSRGLHSTFYEGQAASSGCGNKEFRFCGERFLGSRVDTLYTFGDNIIHYKTESVRFWGLMNSATKVHSFGSGIEQSGQARTL